MSIQETIIPIEKEIDIILNEYNLANQRIEGFLSRQDIILQISIAILGGAIGFTLTKKVSDEFLLIIPIIPLFLFSHILYHYSRAIVAQGYREYLQEILNNKMVDGCLKYSNVAKKYLLLSNPFTKINSVSFPAMILSTIIYAIVMSNYNLFNLIGGLTLIGIFGAIGWQFVKFRRKLNEKVYKFCKEGE
ncbi:hypothetical protein QQ008_07455 [Fulvivirgaceae bacterium BMA10]|uniref:Uncharacterized protein n=1 Tax=Splendidivirga corallicola TaxID=3051826 RepID=A0ABT8KKF0_9BACT|nr:hypothetical protein [Fulvivirgaceae bacterium BMA10]